MFILLMRRYHVGKLPWCIDLDGDLLDIILGRILYIVY